MQHKTHILVLGAQGKLGRLLAGAWENARPEQRPKHLIAHWQSTKKIRAGDIIWSPGMAWPEGLPQFEAIVALWGVTPATKHVGPTSEGDHLAENCALAQAAMDLGRVLGVKRVLHCSTAAVYEPSPDPLCEEQAGGALNRYGAAKLAMEQVIGEDAAAHPDGPTQCILRIANFAGADSLFAGLDRGDGPITLDQFDDGQGPMRSYLTPSGLGQAIEALLQCPRAALPDVLNVAAPGAVAMADLVRAAGREVAWKPAPQGAAPRVELDVARLRAICSECRPQSARDIVADVARARGEAKGST